MSKPSKLAIYGYGKLGHLVEEVLKANQITIDGIFDKTLNTPLPENPSEYILINCVSAEPTAKTIKERTDEGWVNIHPAWDAIQNLEGITNGWKIDFNEYKGHDVEMTRWVGTHLSDGCSWWHYTAFLNWHETRTEVCPMPWAEINCENRWLIPEILSALKKKISRTFAWGIKEEGSTLADIKNRRYVFDYTKIDPCFWRYAMLHCEGLELESLRVNMKVFVKHRPIIGVTCYHNVEGAWQIEKMLMDSLNDYNFHFRLHAYMGTSAIMYCIPKEVA